MNLTLANVLDLNHLSINYLKILQYFEFEFIT